MIKKSSHNQLKTILIIGSALAFLLGLWVAFSPNYSALQYHRVNKRLEDVQARNTQLEKENAELQQEITRLKDDPDYIEEVARKDYGLMKKNEVTYDFEPRKR